jgi:CBS-domain-containing membrane protein
MPPKPLELFPLESNLAAPRSGNWHVALEDPARTVMTDFNEHGLVTVAATMQVDEALEVMKHAGVRSAFVLDEGGASILGLITAYDIMGEKPIRHLQLTGGAREEVLVADIMDRAGDWHVARLEDVDRSRVSSVLDTFQRVGRTHLAVVEQESGKGPRLRGVFSAARLLKLTEAARRVAKAKRG